MSFPVLGLRFYYVEPSYSTATSVGPGFSIPPLYAADAAWHVQEVKTRVEFYNSGGSTLPMHVSAWDTIGGAVADATLGGPQTSAGSCNLRFARGTFWYNGTGSLPPGGTDFWTVALHDFGHLTGLGHSESQLQSEVAGGWFTGMPSTGVAQINSLRRAIHIDDIQRADVRALRRSARALNLVDVDAGQNQGHQTAARLCGTFASPVAST